jgi:hypothetical protein
MKKDRIRKMPALFLAAAIATFSGCGREPALRTDSNSPVAKTPSKERGDFRASEWVGRLASLNVTNGTLSIERANEWKQSLAQLERQPDAVAAIGDFLNKNIDLNFEPGGNDVSLGAPTLRLAMLHSLENIGGSNAVALAAQTLQRTADPAELATLIRYLDRVEPENHRAAAVAAARETLALATTRDWDGRDVAPLFEILKRFGGGDALAVIEKYANTWFDYAAITLLHWPDDAGIQALIRLAQNADGRLTLGHEIYQRALAQVAVENAAAADALVEQTKQNKIDVNAWPAVGSALAGNTLHLAKPLLEAPAPLAARPDTRKYHVSVGNQNFLEAMPPEKMERNEAGRRIRLVDRLLEATTNPAALDALENARISLAARLPAVR